MRVFCGEREWEACNTQPSLTLPPPLPQLLAAHALRYLDLHTNSYIRFLTGHTAPVSCVSFSPTRDAVASADSSGAVLWWDVRSPGPTARLDAPSRATVAFDEQGLIVAVAADGSGVRLFSAAELSRGPFLTLPLGTPAGFGTAPPDRLAFDGAGRSLVASGGGALAVVDAFRGGPPPPVRAPRPAPPRHPAPHPGIHPGRQVRAVRVPRLRPARVAAAGGGGSGGGAGWAPCARGERVAWSLGRSRRPGVGAREGVGGGRVPRAGVVAAGQLEREIEVDGGEVDTVFFF